MRWIALVSLLAGCDYLFNLDHVEPRDVDDIDANVGVVLDAAPCVDGTFVGKYGPGGAGLLQVCVPSSHPVSVALTASISTDTDCDAVLDVDSLHTEVCVKWGSTVTIAGGVVAHGPRPLVVVATETITAAGLLDVASHNTGTPGAGANWSGCNTLDGGPSPTGGGGAPGGSFGSRGGNGGIGGTGAARPSRLVAPPDRIRGGCGGGTGGAGMVPGGLGGAGGGAVYLIAGISITVDGTATINASGGGGLGGGPVQIPDNNGGGGGGGASGGLIGLDAPTVTIDPSARMLANGGGGGGGGSGGTTGGTGAEPMPATLMSPAPGGLGGGAGGVGAAGATDASAGGTAKSGGGGGGGAGYILVATTGPFLCGNCSPTAIAAP